MTVRWAAAAATAAALLAVSGCGSSDSGQQATGGPMKLERITKTIGCKSSLQTDSAELRQSSCRKAKQTFIVLTFASKTGQRTWLDNAKPYGGDYLVGTRWVVEADLKALGPVQKELGGSVEAGEDHGSH